MTVSSTAVVTEDSPSQAPSPESRRQVQEQRQVTTAKFGLQRLDPEPDVRLVSCRAEHATRLEANNIFSSCVLPPDALAAQHQQLLAAQLPCANGLCQRNLS